MGHQSYFSPDDLERVDGRLKVTGAAKYTAEYDLPGLCYGVIVDSTIAKGRISSIDSKKAEKATGVIAVLSHLNAPKIPGYAPADPSKPAGNQPLRILYDDKIYFAGQPVVIVVADTYERALYAASLLKVQYEKESFETDPVKNLSQAVAPRRSSDYKRGEANAYATAPVKIEAEYIIPTEVHNPMEMHSTIASWDGDDKVTVYEKTQGVKSAQNAIISAFKLKEENVKVIAEFVGGGFGSGLRTWPHAIGTVLAAKAVKKPVKLVLSRPQMFTMVGYRPYTVQQVGIGATQDGKLVGITHKATSITSRYEEFTEGTTGMSRFMYACPNVNTEYKVLPLDVSTPTWMRGPGEATGAFALESAMDELAYALKIDPLDLRILNYAETDPERRQPFSSKFLKEAYQLGADKIGWYKRNPVVGSMKNGEWLVGYGMSSGVFNAGRGRASVKLILQGDGSVVIQSAVSDSGPGTATAMTVLAMNALNMPESKITFDLGDTSLPPGPSQGGSGTTSSLGSAVYEVCEAFKQKILELAATKNEFLKNMTVKDVAFDNGTIALNSNKTQLVSFTDVLRQNNLPSLEITKSSQGGDERKGLSFYSYSVHFTEVHVHPLTGIVRVKRAVTVADAGKIVNKKTASSQMIGGVAGGIGMALMEEGVIDHNFGKYVNNSFAGYHVAINADVPHTDVLFVDKPDPNINPMGSKGLGEIALIGFAAAVANAVYHATGKRIRELPITPDKLLV
jgi:xanthine dehydrogenase YagR molybdenum-binding subunit